MRQADYLLRRLHSLMGLIPLAISVPLHMFMVGNEYIEDALGNPPILLILVIMIVPLVIHGLIGLYILRQNTGARARRSGAVHKLQRGLTALVALFICVHPFLFRAAMGDLRLFWPTAALFLVGILSLSYHIGYGVYTFSMAWGWTRTPGRRLLARIAAWAYGLLLSGYMLSLYARVFITMHGVLTGVIVR